MSLFPVVTSFVLGSHLHYCHIFLHCFLDVVSDRTVQRSPSNPWIKKKFFFDDFSIFPFWKLDGHTRNCWGIFFAAIALPPNGLDQRLSHCSLPLCLCSESAHCKTANPDPGSETVVSSPLQASPTVSLPWHQSREFLELQRQKKDKRSLPKGHGFQTAVSLRPVIGWPLPVRTWDLTQLPCCCGPSPS